MTADIAHHWQPIKDLPPDLGAHRNADLAAMAPAWEDIVRDPRSRQLVENARVRTFRHWSVDAGHIEGLYHLGRGVTETLVTQGLYAAVMISEQVRPTPEKIEQYLHDQQAAIEGVFRFVKDQRTLSTSYIKELHQVLTAHQETSKGLEPITGKYVEIPLLKGDWKKFPNNPVLKDGGGVHEYCPPVQTASEMDRLLEMHAILSRHDTPAETHAAWLHHRFVQIHPFQDGNGRVARALVALVFLKAGLPVPVILTAQKGAYLDALQAADQGNLRPLINFLALCCAAEIGKVSEDYRDIILQETRDGVHSASTDGAARLRETARKLREFMKPKLAALCGRLKAQPPAPESQVLSAELTEDAEGDVSVIRELAHKGPLEPAIDAFFTSLALTITSPSVRFRATFAVFATNPVERSRYCVFCAAHSRRRDAGSGTSSPDRIHDIGEPFFFDADEDPEQALARFGPRFEISLTRALSEWKRALGG